LDLLGFIWRSAQAPTVGEAGGDRTVKGHEDGDHGRDYLPDHYLADAAGYNVIGVVRIEAHWDPKDRVGETRWVRSLANGGSDHGLLKGIVGEADISSDDVERELEGHAADRSARSTGTS
jgi:predicted TIM-barrel fold metal-dependent hydrolase